MGFIPHYATTALYGWFIHTIGDDVDPLPPASSTHVLLTASSPCSALQHCLRCWAVQQRLLGGTTVLLNGFYVLLTGRCGGFALRFKLYRCSCCLPVRGYETLRTAHTRTPRTAHVSPVTFSPTAVAAALPRRTTARIKTSYAFLPVSHVRLLPRRSGYRRTARPLGRLPPPLTRTRLHHTRATAPTVYAHTGSSTHAMFYDYPHGSPYTRTAFPVARIDSVHRGFHYWTCGGWY